MSGAGPRPRAIHATALVVGEAGVLIRGASGAGKTALALACIAAAQQRGLFAALVGDDRVLLAARGGRVVVGAHAAMAGKVERRGLAIAAAAHEAEAVLRLVVELVEDRAEAARLPRLPWSEASAVEVEGVMLPLLRLDTARQRADQVELVLAALEHASSQG